jgi:EAL domain-containing protein (putative c-di-GMP-specific phosphodiesterase class I)
MISSDGLAQLHRNRRGDIERDLAQALERHELFLLYQPIVETGTGTTRGFEALLRWARADGTVLRPDAFLPVAEQSGLIVDIGTWAVREACSQLRAWRAARPSARPRAVAVNVARRQLLTAELADEVLAWLPEITPDRLILEISEPAAAELPDVAVQTLEQLTGHGVRIAIDDFGTAESCPAALHLLPVHQVKLDQQFVAGIASSARDRDSVRAMLELAGALALTPIAEGVETEAQARILSAAGCELAQGHLFDRPRPPEDVRIGPRRLPAR